jgi:hypothetical protein
VSRCSIPEDLVPLAVIAARLPGKTEKALRRMSLQGAFPDLMKVGRDFFVREADVDAWQRGCWQSVREAIADAAARNAGLPPIRNRRAKAVQS